MAYNRSHINTNGSFNTSQKSSLLKTFDEVDGGTGSLTPQAGPAALTDSSAGTPGTTLAAIDNTTYATAAPVLRNWIASVNARIDGLQAALEASGILT